MSGISAASTNPELCRGARPPRRTVLLLADEIPEQQSSHHSPVGDKPEVTFGLHRVAAAVRYQEACSISGRTSASIWRSATDCHDRITSSIAVGLTGSSGEPRRRSSYALVSLRRRATRPAPGSRLQMATSTSFGRAGAGDRLLCPPGAAPPRHRDVAVPRRRHRTGPGLSHGWRSFGCQHASLMALRTTVDRIACIPQR